MINTEAFTKRLQKVIDYYGETASSFAEKIGVQRSSISHILSGRNKPSLEFVLKILSAFPEVELYWLLNGKGEFPAIKKSVDVKPVDIKPEPPPVAIQEKIQFETKKEKTIESIVIFYTDGSFKNFKN
ncbi:helix-turn-helix domain-containing protein [Mariniflexile aquimaris]|uniref:Helix-turn-helix domain-containing protein n=1 Tax=Mariniflexile aquimaris TaxID=881009 RepID=A0ABW3BVD8_9FLAO